MNLAVTSMSSFRYYMHLGNCHKSYFIYEALVLIIILSHLKYSHSKCMKLKIPSPLSADQTYISPYILTLCFNT
jgi:hypothetical protein